MAKVLRSLIAVLIIAGGVVLFNYPTLATFVNNIFANREISEYIEAASSLDEEELNEKIETAQVYNQSLPLAFPADPILSTNIRNFAETEFENFEMLQDGALIGYVEVPEIDVYQPVYYGTSDEVLEKGLGLIENTSLPVGGPGTHAVISGHTGMATRKLLTDLNQLEEGDTFFVHVLNQHFAYQVDQIEVVLPDETEELSIIENQDYVTLLTCTPFGVNDHRLLVRGTRLKDYDFSVKAETPVFIQKLPAYRQWMKSLGLGLLIIILFILLVRHDLKHPKRRKRRRKRYS